jgi:hypothetical protein
LRTRAGSITVARTRNQQMMNRAASTMIAEYAASAMRRDRAAM